MKLPRLLTLAFLLANLSAAAMAAEARPNIVFILADDLGWSDTTLNGQTKLYQTPNLDRLAKRGMTFSRAYSASPLCSPTRASILTGQSPARLGLTTPNCHEPQVVLEATPGKSAGPGNKAIQPSPVTRLKTTYETLPKTLKAAGYATGHFGKWHLGPEPYSALQQGFEVDLPHFAGPGPAGSYVAPWKFKDFDHDPAIPDEHIEDRMAKEAVSWMEKHAGGPFLLNYWMFSVHAPFDAKKSLIEKYRGKVNPNDPQRSPTYAAMVESMDDAVGTLLDALDRLKIADRTIIVFFSDNGGNMYNTVDGTTPTSNVPLKGGKATMYEGGIRVPAVVAWPGVTAAGTRSESVVQSTDFYQTFLDGLGLKAKDGQIFDGTSVMPALRGEPMKHGPIFTYFPHNPPVPDWLPPSVSVHRDDWKLIRLFHAGENGAHRWKLFNLREDLGEQNDLSAKEPERVKELDALIEKFLADTKAVVPTPNPAFDPAKYHPEEEGKSKMNQPAKPGAKPKAAPKAATAGEDNPQLQGWKARNCTATVKDGIVTVAGQGGASFLALPAGQVAGATEVKFRVRSAKGGEGKVEWLPKPGADDKAQSVGFQLPGGSWQETTVNLPAEGPLGILRLYLPAQTEAVEIDWISVKCGKGSQRSDF